MKKLTVFLLFGLVSSGLHAQEWPAGTYGGNGQREVWRRPLSQAVAATHTTMNFAGCGTARIDGVLSPAEWSGAATHVININHPDGTISGTLYVMNDNLNLYLAMRFPESAAMYGSLGVEFDNDNDGIAFEQGDDAYVANNQAGFFDDFRTLLPPCPAGAVCGPQDTEHGGTNDGQMGFANSGTESVYETSHPLDSGDTGHDFALAAGQTVGFFIHLRFVDGSGAIHDTTYPDWGVYDTITIQSCLPPVLSGCGTPALDGQVGPAEWSAAGQFRFSVRTPHGGTSPATIYVMNDSFNLYTAVAFDRTATGPAGSNSAILTFDDDHSGFGSIGDDLISAFATGSFYDMVADPCGGGLCAQSDVTLGGTIDGAAAYGNDGVQSAYELAHPLNSGDRNDFALAYGDSIPTNLHLTVTDSPGVFPVDYAQTSFPTGVIYATFSICTPAAGSAVDDLTGNVDDLAAGGVLDSKDATVLKKDLGKAEQSLREGNIKKASKELGHFVWDVTKMMRKGDLQTVHGRPLVDAANSAIRQLEQ